VGCCEYFNEPSCSINCIKFVRFQVLTAVSMKFIVFWDVAPCSHV
jgi:hypothetical protein